MLPRKPVCEKGNSLGNDVFTRLGNRISCFVTSLITTNEWVQAIAFPPPPPQPPQQRTCPPWSLDITKKSVCLRPDASRPDKINLKIIKGQVSCLSLTSDEQLIIIGTDYPDRDVYVLRTNNGSLVCKLHGHTDMVASVAASHDGQYIVSGSHDCTARVWQLGTKKELCAIKHSRYVYSVAVTPDNQHVVTGCDDHIVRLFHLISGTLVRTFDGHKAAARNVAISADGRWIASSSYDKTVRVWSLTKPNAASFVLVGHCPIVFWELAFHPNGKQIASVIYNKTVCVWTICDWSDRDHQLFRSELKALVFHLMCVKARLDAQTEIVVLPRLPMAVWLNIFAFCSVYLV